MDRDPDDLWTYVTRTVKRLTGKDTGFLHQTAPRRPELYAEKTITDIGSGVVKNQPVYMDASLDKRTAEKLRRGQFPIEARLDLHGLSSAQARERLARFLMGSYGSRLRCVLVITGKGARSGETGAGGVLRRSLPEWLEEPPLSAIVLQYVQAKPRHGGDGAFYILLRRQRGHH